MKTKTVNLAMMRGDTQRFGITIKNYSDTPDSISFSCKRNKKSPVYIFQKVLGNGIEPDEDFEEENQQRYIITISPEDTVALSGGEYDYDLEIIINGDVTTLLEGILKIHQDVTRH